MINWTKDMLRILKEEYPTKSNAEIGAMLGISARAVQWKAYWLGLKKHNSWTHIEWTGKQLELLRQRFPVCSLREVAVLLGISKTMVARKAKELGLQKAAKSETRMKIEETIKTYIGMYPFKKIAEMCGVSARRVGKIAKEMGLTVSKEARNRMTSEAVAKAYELEEFYVSCGLSPEMNRKLGSDKSRLNMEYRLREDGYFVTHGCDVVYFSPRLKRHPIRERNAEEMGMVFVEYPEDCLTTRDNEGAQAPENLINSSIMVITGKITEVCPIREGNKNGHDWKVQDCVLEIPGGEKPQICVFNVFGDDIEKFNIQVGDQLSVDIRMSANKGKDGRWFGNNRAKEVTRA